MSGEVFTDSSMLEIFRAEIETHVESLTSGLLALERSPSDTSHLDEMMRGAHSIKGAARIVGIDPAVQIAHVMEDGFVAAQKGTLTLRPEHVDVLLRGVDMLNRIATATKSPHHDWETFANEVAPLVSEITSTLAPVSGPTGNLSEVGELPKSKTAVDRSELKENAVSAREVTISLPAFFDKAAAEVARHAFVSGIDANFERIRFDLSQTTDLDATGLAFLAAVSSSVRQGGPRLELVGAGREMEQVLHLTGITDLYSAGGG